MGSIASPLVFTKTVLCLVVVFIHYHVIEGFNVDTSHPLLYTDPEMDSESMFGYSIALHRQGGQNMIFVGAPKAQSSFLTPVQATRGGALYKCPIDTALSSVPACTEIELDNEGTTYDPGNNDLLKNATDQWLGSSVVSGGVDGPVVVCRPRLKGIILRNQDQETQALIGGCFATTNGFTNTESFNPCSSARGKASLAGCQFGASAAAKNDRLTCGAPGYSSWNGNLWFKNAGETNLNIPNYLYPANEDYKYDKTYYYGYAVAYGDFKGDSDLEIAVSAPRHAHGYGRVYLFDSTNTDYSMIETSILGTYFGHALAVSDLNNDGSDDLVISAPLYSDELENILNGWEIGAVRIYYNDNQGGFPRYESIVGTEAGCRFGYSVAALGDMDQDGFNDLAVGSPFCGGGEDGQVFLYYGTGRNQPINHTPKQILRPSSFDTTLSFFGFTMSAGLDIDGNTYPDLAIGAHKNQTVVVLRSRAVVSSSADIRSGDSPLDLDMKESMTSQGDSVTGFDITVCISYVGQGLPTELDFEYDVLLDSARQEVNRRAVFVDNERTLATFTMTVSGNALTCVDHQAFISPAIRDKQSPITLSLTYRLFEGGQASDSLSPVLDESSTTQLTSSVSFQRECANATCYPDLAITATTGTSQLIVGTAQETAISIDVINNGEDAFLSFLDIKEIEGLYFVQIDKLSSNEFASCSYSSTSRVRSCQIGNPIKAAASLSFGIHYKTEEYSSFYGDVKLNLTLRSADVEKTEDISDNFFTVSIPVNAKANISFQGTPNPETLIIKEVDYPADRNLTEDEFIGPEISHDISLFNAGPSFIGVTMIEVLFPRMLSSGDVLLNIIDVTTNAGKTCLIATQQNNNTNISVAVNQTSDEDPTAVFLNADCDLLPECYVISCSVDSVGPGDNADRSSAMITVTARVNADAALAEASIDHIKIVSTTSAVVEGSIYQGIEFSPHPTVESFQVYTKLNLEFHEPKDELPLWVYIVSALGGLAILTIVVLILYALGFFKRKQITNEQREVLVENRKERKRASKAASVLYDQQTLDALENAGGDAAS